MRLLALALLLAAGVAEAQIVPITSQGTIQCTPVGGIIPVSCNALPTGFSLGTPSALVLTNATGLPLATGVTGSLPAASFPTLTGDVSNTGLATTVSKINGASVPSNAGVLASGAMSQLFANTTPIANSFTAQPLTTPVTLIYDDDCTGDVDCVFSLSALHHWVDAGNAKVLAIMANSANAYASPVENIIDTYWGHGSIPIGTYKGSNITTTGNTSLWTAGTVTQFNAGDTSSNYPDCVTVYRTVLAAAANSSVEMVSTGFVSCIAALMVSAADGISPLTGAQLIKAKVTGLYLLGGDYPTGTEFNMVNDPVDANYLFINWTTQNGYPNITLNGFTPGSTLVVGRPLGFPQTDPATWAAGYAGHINRPGWDILSIYQAVFGLSAFTASANGTNSVNASTGANSWSSSTASGHIYYTLSNAATYYDALLDGQFYQGANWWMPAQKSTSSAIQSPGLMCSKDLAGCQMVGTTVALAVAANTPTITSTANVNSATNTAAYFINPGLVTGEQLNLQFGHDLSTNNAGFLAYDYSTIAGSQHIGLGFYGGSEILTVYQKGQVVANGGLLGLNVPAGTATYAAGTNVTSVACASGYTCTNTRGTLTIVGGTATTGTIASMTFSATLNSTPMCFATQNGGATHYGIGNSAATASTYNITAAASVSGATLTVNYICLP